MEGQLEMKKDNLSQEFKILKYFVVGYFNQGYNWGDLEELVDSFISSESPNLVNELKICIERLQELQNNNDRETWKEIEKILYEDSMRYIEFEDGLEFINRIESVLDKIK